MRIGVGHGVQSRPVAAEAPTAPPAAVVNLMDALRRSVWATGGEEGQAGGEGRSTVGKAEGGLVGI